MIRAIFSFCIVFISLLFTCFETVHAQIQKDTLSYQLDTLQVEAIRANISSTEAPLALSIKTRNLQEQTADASSSLTSLTYNLPGIWVNDRQNNALGEKITIRGIGWRAAFGVRGIQMVLDGIPITTAGGQSITNLIDPAFINRVELIRGPAASYWGNSSGGVLYLSSEPASRDRTNFYLRAYTGSYENNKVDFRYNHRTENHRFSSFTSYQRSEGYRNYSASKLLRTGIRGSSKIDNKSRLNYTGALLWMPKAQHPSGLTAEQVTNDPSQARQSFVAADAGKQITHGQLGVSYERSTSTGLLSVSSYGTYRDLNNPLPFGIITVDRLAGGLRSAFDMSFNGFDIRAGAELKYQHDDREEFENVAGDRGDTTVDQVEKVRNQALFITSNYEIGRFNLLGSLRYDRITFNTATDVVDQAGKRSFQDVSPGLGVNFEIGNSIIYSNLSTSFEAPTTTELVNRPDGGNGFNPDIKPERTIGLELGSRGSVSQNLLEYDIALYNLWIKDLLFPYQLEADGPTFYRNQGETRHRGIEIAATLNITDALSLGATYTLTDAKFVEAQETDGTPLDGNTVPGIADHRLSSTLSWSPGSWLVSTSGRYISSYPVNNLNTAHDDGFFRLDAKISYRKGFEQAGMNLTPFVNINNIFDEQYNGSVYINAFGGRYYEPAPGRNWRAGLSLNF